MTLVDIWNALENLELSQAIAASAWFPFLEAVHVLTSAFLFGSILMVDLRLLGVSARRYAVSQIIGEVVPWTLGAAVLSTATGIGMFITQANHYAVNRAFQIKMVLLILAGVNMLVFHRRTFLSVAEWDQAERPISAARFAGACSIALWIAVMLAGRWIGHLSQ
jgi:hypothetical protein